MNTKPVTCAVLFLTPSNKVLIVHPTGSHWQNWSFPKGLLDEGELPFEAAARELSEETGLIIDGTLLDDMGRFVYVPEKDYHLFMYRSVTEPVVEQLICESMFTNRVGVVMPEVDDFKFVTLNEAVTLLNKKQSAILSSCMEVGSV